MTTLTCICFMQPITALSPITIHYLGPFGIVVCLGLIQVLVTYYGVALAIESLPPHVSDQRRRTHKKIHALLLVAFVTLTFSLAKLNDNNQYASALAVERQQMQQEVLRAQLRTTGDALGRSADELNAIRRTIEAHPPGEERSTMLNSLNGVQETLQRQQAMAMRQTDAQGR